MPLYEYECESCGNRFEKIQKFSDPPIDICPNCGKGPVRKLLSSPAIQFKGTGWYITDYAKKSSAPSAKESKDTKDTKDAKDTKDTKDTASTATESKSAAPEKKD
jgi:putative FmdB family regulatory protein